MALDAQRNWDVEMSQLRDIRTQQSAKDIEQAVDKGQSSSPSSVAGSLREIWLPTELIEVILSHVPHRASEQKTLWACSLVSRSWYAATVARLYERPYLRGSNFESFVVTVCPSKNAKVRRSQLAELVKKLDMGDLVHDGSKSLTARLLGRFKISLEEFVAPQASFALISFAALSKCARLTYLDLSLISASISLKLLFQTLSSLTALETLFFPRTASQDKPKDLTSFAWPPSLTALHLAGGIDDLFLRVHLSEVPQSLHTLSIQHCPQVYTFALQQTLERLGPQLQQLTVRHPMNRLQRGVLDHTLGWCPRLRALRISADYISDFFFDAASVPERHPLRVLELDCSPNADAAVDISANSCYIAVADDRLPHLRSVRVNARLAWTASPATRQDAMDLAEALEGNEIDEPLGVATGVWIIDE